MVCRVQSSEEQGEKMEEVHVEQKKKDVKKDQTLMREMEHYTIQLFGQVCMDGRGNGHSSIKS